MVSFPGVKRPGRGVDHPSPSSVVVKEVELFTYSSSVLSWPVLWRPLPLLTAGCLVFMFDNGCFCTFFRTKAYMFYEDVCKGKGKVIPLQSRGWVEV